MPRISHVFMSFSAEFVINCECSGSIVEELAATLRYYPSICLEGLWRSPSRESNCELQDTRITARLWVQWNTSHDRRRIVCESYRGFIKVGSGLCLGGKKQNGRKEISKRDVATLLTGLAEDWDFIEVQVGFHIYSINPLNTKRKLFHLKIQFVPRSKHFSSRLKKQINLCYTRQKSLFAVI
jgi:hypothetical protein